ncbi:MAG: tripartite tricarboxylate transporter permease, partial [Treponema sp.]|nr:tripartite tricarboxylate transporter permease [Treponema sp.]
MSSIIDGVTLGLSGLSDPVVLLMLALGSLIGTLVGALPGLGATSGCALLLPVAFSMKTPQQGLSILTAIYLGCMFGGRITSILINVPGEPQAVVTTFEGYPMMKQGRGGVALGITAISSFFGGFVSFVLLALVAMPLARVALKFGPPEYFTVMLFGFAAVVGLAEKQYLRSLMTMALGMLISMIGMDFLSGVKRYVYTMGMFEGIDFSVIVLGLFGIAEMMAEAENLPSATSLKEAKSSLSLKKLIPSWAEIKESTPSIIRGTLIGIGIGVLPAVGATVATFISYSTEKSVAKDPSKFGKGYIVGVAGPEASSNASVGGSIVPTLALGIPGSATTAIILGAMAMFGLQTGPRVFETSALVVWTLIVGLFVANIMLLLCNTLMIPFFVWL